MSNLAKLGIAASSFLLGMKTSEFMDAKISPKANIEEVVASDIKPSQLDSISNTINSMNWTQQAEAWQRTADSIRWKGAADSAYHKGAQMVRDSVAAAKAVK